MKLIRQYDKMDCGPSCLGMVANSYGKEISLNYLREKCHITKEGVSLLGIDEAATELGFETFSASLDMDELKKVEDYNFPCILHWNNNHFVVLKGYGRKSFFSRQKKWQIADPGHGFIDLNDQKFKKSWLGENETGIAFFLKPKEKFFKTEFKQPEKISLNFFLKYFVSHKKKLGLVFILMLLGSLINMIFPFLTQFLIDKGISNKDINYIQLILFSQLSLYLGAIIIEIFRNWSLLIVGTKISIKIISEFLTKILELPLRFFDSKLIGDFQQRIQDNDRIEYFLTSQSIATFFSTITFSVFFIVLAYYNPKVLLIYVSLTVLSLLWSNYFLKKRKILDYHRFVENSNNQETIYEILNGVSEMKLNNFEEHKCNQWKEVQNRLFKINLKILKLDQIQSSGFNFINHIKNICVSFYTAVLVVQGDMSLGVLLSVSYIIGMMNSPVDQLVSFLKSLQDAKLSLARLNEVQTEQAEEKETYANLELKSALHSGIKLSNVSFQYEGPRSPFVLKNIDMYIPDGKITAIVGASGSGKTTLMKMLLRFYDSITGHISFNGQNILNLSPKDLRKNCGVVMQDGFIFSDSIKRNIATADEEIDYDRLKKAAQIANIEEYIESLPLKYDTKIGASGSGLSGGQKQRILIARAVYKNPHYVFFDEATSALDAENEKIIHDNLFDFFKGKTVVIIAHRLSTVKHADQIVVLKKGEISEVGSHAQLVERKGDYFSLVKNQLELGS
ncbi:MAG: ABC transporter ATP-binding protein [Flavobacterium sp.]|uniref:peptidase domain-containing ABC transporter n=1 Tax=unclassified Flavobacterium TaxID=196869 RepID=UPI000C5AAF63|nr:MULTISPECIES: peptidase domain-containing ABC transporter [unclassified Flavobacterium]MBF04413.1 ABC transporter ATP-binding protein [Flavobacterium sp.]MCO6161851.1 peptidase domain-containing ABC transporter [Flavobacterium sp. NRK F7]